MLGTLAGGSLGFCGQRISGYSLCGNAEIDHRFCGLRILAAFLRNECNSAKLVLFTKT